MSDESKLVELGNYAGEDKIVHFTDYLLNNVSKGSRVKRFGSEFQVFDERCGLETGEVVVVSGNTKSGKTLFAESWCHSMLLKDPKAKTLIFSFEVQCEKMLVKYMKEEKLPLYVPSGLKTMDFEWLKNRCLEAKLKYDCSIVLIDHLHFLVDMMTKQNMSLNIGAFMRRLKQEIAIGLNMAVILIAHQGQPKDEREASLSNIRDSSFVGQESDATILVSRRENYSRIDFPEIAKKYGEERAREFFTFGTEADDDKFSQGLSIVKVACHRRTGVFDSKKLFKKIGHFLAEV